MRWVGYIFTPIKLLYKIILIFTSSLWNSLKNIQKSENCVHEWVVVSENKYKKRKCTQCSMRQHYNEYYGKWKTHLL